MPMALDLRTEAAQTQTDVPGPLAVKRLEGGFSLVKTKLVTFALSLGRWILAVISPSRP